MSWPHRLWQEPPDVHWPVAPSGSQGHVPTTTTSTYAIIKLTHECFNATPVKLLCGGLRLPHQEIPGFMAGQGHIGPRHHHYHYHPHITFSQVYFLLSPWEVGCVSYTLTYPQLWHAFVSNVVVWFLLQHCCFSVSIASEWAVTGVFSTIVNPCAWNEKKISFTIAL